MTSLLADLRFALRGLRSQPALCHRRDAVAGTRHRRQYGDLHADRPDPAEEAARARPGRAGDAHPARQPQRQQHGIADALVSHLPGLPAEGGAALAGHRPPAGLGVVCGRQPDRAARCRDGVGQLLLDAGRQARHRARAQLEGRRPGLQRPPRRCPLVRLLGVALRPRPRRHRQESADQQLPDDHRRGLGGRIRRPRPGAVAADPRADPDEAGGAARMDLDAGRRSALALGAGVRAAEAGSDRGKRSAADAGPVHANPEVRSDAAGGQGLVCLLEGAVPEGDAARREGGHRLFQPAQRLLHRARRPDVHGRPGAAHRLRQRRQPAHRPRVHAPARDRGPAVARRDQGPPGAAAAGRKPAALGHWRSARRVRRRRAHARPAGAHPVREQPAADPGRAGPADPRASRSLSPWRPASSSACCRRCARAGPTPGRR